MTAPIRPEIFALCEHSEDALPTLTLRQAVNWFKQVAQYAAGASALEGSYLDRYWAAIIKALATREGIPEGWLSYSLGQLAQAESRLVDTALQEATAAVRGEP